ncbi:chemotaxis protein CheY [Vibrio caribbeanicus]|uniref:Chemotaxis protein CheY n=1 Tax=Vibrio caribbeanicus TaxID=701175 RepID=A0ACC4NTM4_9VIBR|nr:MULTISPECIES: response regulator [Vibrio]KHD23921.1 chemotaxis protein CheY [Vibrio caribbeanicus]KHT49516.1 chemotaxis protein CheY [Vibrio sinaloensis]
MFNVLIIEDDRNIAALHSQFISRDNRFQVLAIAESLAQAHSKLAQTVFDLVIIDNYLPDGLGIDFLQQMRKLPNPPESILVTAANDVETVQKALRCGALDYLVKPLDYQRFAQSLEKFALVQHTLSHGISLAQGELDALFQKGVPSNKKSSTDAHTLKQILDEFYHANVELSVSAIAESFSISKSTARRYLDKGVEQGELEAFLAHGKVGRPTRIYRRIRFEL